MGTKKKDIRLLTEEELTDFFVNHNEKAFRAKQVYDWLWNKGAQSFDHMTNLSIPTREMLRSYFSLEPVRIHTLHKSKDKTIKVSFLLSDNKLIEGVLIPSEDRVTACISSQVGCKLGCKFCATGLLGFDRNLEAYEIVEQVALLDKEAHQHYGRGLSNIVYMGMGEPFLNYANVVQSIHLITSERGLGMSPKRITVSTSGIAKAIKQLADDNPKVNLAISLHAANPAKRDVLMPINSIVNLSDLSNALVYFHEKTGIRITYEYVLLDGINDSIEDALALAHFCKISPCKINIIEYNQVPELPYKKSPRLTPFVTTLENKGLIVNVRASRGEDINAACGQLANTLKG